MGGAGSGSCCPPELGGHEQVRPPGTTGTTIPTREPALPLWPPEDARPRPPAPSPPEELAEGLVVGQRVVVGLREQVVHVVQTPLGHELPGGLGLLRTRGPGVESEAGPSHPHPHPQGGGGPWL